MPRFTLSELSWWNSNRSVLEGIAPGVSLMLICIIKASGRELALCQALQMVSGNHGTSRMELGRINITDYIESTGIISDLWVWLLSGFELIIHIKSWCRNKAKQLTSFFRTERIIYSVKMPTISCYTFKFDLFFLQKIIWHTKKCSYQRFQREILMIQKEKEPFSALIFV